MSTAGRVAAFVAGLLVAFGVAFGAGRAVGPLDDPGGSPSQHESPSRGTTPHDEKGVTHDE